MATGSVEGLGPGDTDRSAGSVFKADLAAAILACASAWLLPTVTVGLAVAEEALRPNKAIVAISLPLLVFEAGWLGTQRIWFLRIQRGLPFTFEEARTFTWRFIGRYAALGLVLSLPLIPLVVAFRVNLLAGIILFSLIFLVLDACLTFVTPALAFSTGSVREAGQIGRRMIRTHWPECAWFVVAPPFAIRIVAGISVSARGLPLWSKLLLAATSSAVLLLFRLAVANYYLRDVEVGSSGAA